jgi:dTDP-4-dehydrorhamnose reductase
MKKRVLIFGPTGMLGNTVYGVLKNEYSLVLAARNPNKINLLEKAHGETKNHAFIEFDAERIFKDFTAKQGGHKSAYLNNFWNKVGDVDYAINAVGLTVGASAANPALAMFVNGALPHILSEKLGAKLINVTTDCAFDGRIGNYNETSPLSPIDIYGLSKIMGEPKNCLNLRTSLIGRELETAGGLLEWFLSQDGKTVNGFANQLWSGITAKQYGLVCHKIMSQPEHFPKTGTYHIFGTALSKHDMLHKFQKKYNTRHTINAVEEPRVNRTLSTIYDFNAKLGIPSFEEMLKEL